MRGGQVSFEYLFIMAFAILLIAPLLIVYYTQTQRLTDETAAAGAARAAAQVAEAADTVYYLGAPSVRTIAIDLPENVESVTFAGTAVTLRMRSGSGAYDQNAWSVANLSGTVVASPGPHTLLVAATATGVEITER